MLRVFHTAFPVSYTHLDVYKRQLDGRVVLHQALQLLVVHQIALARADVRVGERLVD